MINMHKYTEIGTACAGISYMCVFGTTSLLLAAMQDRLESSINCLKSWWKMIKKYKLSIKIGS